MACNVIKAVYCKVTYPDGAVDNGMSRLPPKTGGQNFDGFFTMWRDGVSLVINMSHVAKIEYEIEYEVE